MATRRGPKLKGPTTDKDFEIFENLCGMQCTLEELASAFSVAKDTIIKRVEEHYETKFSTIFKQKREKGTISLRRAQWKTAVQKENVTMQIFLGKQYLGQSDRPEGLLKTQSVVYSTKIGESGEILTEVKNREDWEEQKKFDATKILKVDDAKPKTSKKKPKKFKTK